LTTVYNNTILQITDFDSHKSHMKETSLFQVATSWTALQTVAIIANNAIERQQKKSHRQRKK